MNKAERQVLLVGFRRDIYKSCISTLERFRVKEIHGRDASLAISSKLEAMCDLEMIVFGLTPTPSQKVDRVLATIPPDRLEKLADWIDIQVPTSTNPDTEVQDDLRRLAAGIREVSL